MQFALDLPLNVCMPQPETTECLHTRPAGPPSAAQRRPAPPTLKRSVCSAGRLHQEGGKCSMWQPWNSNSVSCGSAPLGRSGRLSCAGRGCRAGVAGEMMSWVDRWVYGRVGRSARPKSCMCAHVYACMPERGKWALRERNPGK